jgi:PAS domain S-box-containing protein
MNLNGLRAMVEEMRGHVSLIQVAPGFPVLAMSRASRALAADPDSALGRPLFELFPEAPGAPGSVEKATASFDEAVRSRCSTSFEQRFDLVERNSGQFEARYWVATSIPILGDAGNVEYILCQAEEEAGGRLLDAAAAHAEQEHARLAEESEHRRRIYDTALNIPPDFVYIFDTDHRCLYANEALLKVWGVADVRGKNWIELGYEQWHADMHDRELAQVIATRAPIRGEIPFTGTNGRRIYDYIFAPVFGAAGEVVAVAGTTRDVTERHASEQIIREHADRLAEADRAKDEFLATLSHELRNPLAPLRNGLEILRRSAEADPQASVHAMMQRQVDHLVRLVDDLMEVSRLTRGVVSLQLEPVELSRVIDNAIEAARPLIDQRAHQLSVEMPERMPVIRADRVRVAQILANLLNNAAKYSEPGGSIVLRGQVDENTLTLSVIDSGIGMNPAEIPRLFEMFTRGDRVRSSHQGGLGIGLALARRLALLHGGSLEATSDGPGQGSVFNFRLPLPTDRPAESFEPATAPVALALRILLVDDQQDVGGSLAETLRLLGADVHFFADGADALRDFARIDPDVAILDIGMPRITGYDVARTLRARGVRVPLVALTGWSQEADRQRAFAAGFDHHLVKPVAISALAKLLQSIELAAAPR